jgi:hypothetical protein
MVTTGRVGAGAAMDPADAPSTADRAVTRGGVARPSQQGTARSRVAVAVALPTAVAVVGYLVQTVRAATGELTLPVGRWCLLALPEGLVLVLVLLVVDDP